MTSRNLEADPCAQPTRVIRSDELAATLDVLAGDEVGERGRVRRLGCVPRHDDVVAGLRQFVGRGQAAESAADDDDARAGALERERGDPIADQDPAAAASDRRIISRRVRPSSDLGAKRSLSRA